MEIHRFAVGPLRFSTDGDRAKAAACRKLGFPSVAKLSTDLARGFMSKANNATDSVTPFGATPSVVRVLVRSSGRAFSTSPSAG